MIQTIKFSNKDKGVFYKVLKGRVDQYFIDQSISKKSNFAMIFKSISLLLGYLIPFICILYFQLPIYYAFPFWIFMGVSIAGIGMSIMHDANHGSYTDSYWLNYFLGHTLNLIGGSVTNWKVQHNYLHHTFTNIAGADDDIQDRKVLKFSPHYKISSMHKYQKYYAFVFYAIITLYWVFVKDIVQFVEFTKKKIYKFSSIKTILLAFKIIIDKLIYLYLIIVLPVHVFELNFSEVITGFLLMHFVAGFILSLIFQLAHTVEAAAQPLPNEKGVVENSWAIHQLETTVDFSPNNKWLSWYIGGLNYQIEHHLFPSICHVHYPKIASIVKQTAKEFGIPYLVNPTFKAALNSHLLHLEKVGKMPSMNEMVG